MPENIIELTKEKKKEMKKEVKEILKNEPPKDTIVKPELSREEKVDNFFEKMQFWSLDDEQKAEVAQRVKNDSVPDPLYWGEIFLASIIATLGLLQNNVAVIIGAMLIAPFLRPINALSFTIARGGQKFFSVAFSSLLISVGFSIFIWYVVTQLIGIHIETSEMLARTSANIIDFFIAIFSAMVAVLSLRYSRLWESVAGMAMAASLMPPLAVVGIELALWGYSAALWAFTLFLANIVAIIAVGTICFWLYWFTPHDEKLQHKSFTRMAVVVFLSIIILIPLSLSFYTIKQNNNLSLQARSYLENIFEWKNIEIKNLSIGNIWEESITIKSQVKIPEGVNIQEVLSKNTVNNKNFSNKKIILDLEVIRGVEVEIGE